MKYFQCIFFITLVCRGQSLSDNEIDSDYEENEINSSFYKFLNITLRDVLKKKNGILGFPILDPFLKNNFELDINLQDVIAKIILKDLKIKGMSNYKVNHSSVSILSRKIVFKLDFTNIYAESFYNLNGTNNIEAHIFGNGKINATIKNLFIDAIINFSIVPGVSISSVETQTTIRALHFNITGLYNDTFVSELASLLIEEVAPQLVDEYKKNIAKIFNEYFLKIGNSWLEGLTMKDFIHSGWNIILSKVPSFLKFDQLKITLF